MNCETARSLMQNYLEGRLPTLERNDFVYHVTECAACESDVIAYRDVFRSLREMPRFDPPARLGVAVMAHLHAEGLIHEPRFPWARRMADRYFAVPARVRHPLTAAALVLALYVPVAVILSGTRGSLAGAAEGFARAVLWAQGVLGSISTISALEPYFRAARTVFHAVTAYVSPAMLIAAGVVAAAIVLSTTRSGRRKRPSGHAMFSL
ncbi:MAG TPA: zf-HC2 domain-containing protein [Candidatus Krumholzibacteria bacterium]|nr:zf-HC2 domain-containing protein [Candidatus Krumholzibacteria bacterium]